MRRASSAASGSPQREANEREVRDRPAEHGTADPHPTRCLEPCFELATGLDEVVRLVAHDAEHHTGRPGDRSRSAVPVGLLGEDGAADRLGLAAEADHDEAMAERVDRRQDRHRVPGPERRLEPGPQRLDGRHVLATREPREARGQEPERAKQRVVAHELESIVRQVLRVRPGDRGHHRLEDEQPPLGRPTDVGRGQVTPGERQGGADLARLERASTRAGR